MAIVFLGIRSGSKGIPNKNIKLFSGKPLFMWTLEAALNAPSVHHIVVSSDSEYYLSMLPLRTSIIPIKRPKDISTDDSSDEDYIQHATTNPNVRTKLTKETVIIRACATSPFQTSDDYELINKQLMDSGYMTSMAVTESTCYLEKGLKIDAQGRLVLIKNDLNQDNPGVLRRQSCRPIYRRSNLIGTTYNAFQKSLSLVHYPSGAVGIPAERGIDIDTEHDWLTGELLMNHYTSVGCRLSNFKPFTFQ